MACFTCVSEKMKNKDGEGGGGGGGGRRKERKNPKWFTEMQTQNIFMYEHRR